MSAADLLEKVARVGSCISVVMKIRSRLQSARTVKPVLKTVRRLTALLTVEVD